jgi:hypothetical protein
MKKIIFLLLFTCIEMHSQELKEFSVPKSYKRIAETKGDLDKDGIDEIVYVYNTNKRVKDLGLKRELYICKKINGTIKLWKKNTTVIWESKNSGFYNDEENNSTDGDNSILEIYNNTLIIQQIFYSNSRHSFAYKDIFRFQNNDWYLIGATSNDSDTCGWNFEYDTNFSTKKVHIIKEYTKCIDEDPEPPKDEEYSFKYPFKETLKMDNFVPGKKFIEMKDSNMNFFY